MLQPSRAAAYLPAIVACALAGVTIWTRVPPPVAGGPQLHVAGSPQGQVAGQFRVPRGDVTRAAVSRIAARTPAGSAGPQPSAAPVIQRRAVHRPDTASAIAPNGLDSFGESLAARLDPAADSPAANSAESGPGALAAPEAGDAPTQRIMFCHPDARGPLHAADVLQACIDRAPAYSSVEIPPGTYVLHRQVVVSSPLTIRTAGSADTGLSCVTEPARCAILMAGPDLRDPFGFLFLRATSNVVLEHLVLDGNRAARLSSPAARSCQLGRNAEGFNAAAVGCLRCALDDMVSRNALCGTAMVWSGAQASIRRSEFSANGDGTTPRMWADGLTLVYAPDSDIRENRFVDNTDIGLIVGYGARSRIEHNLILQRTQTAFAGLMLDNFNSNSLGDFRGAVIASNIVDCGRQLCVFGIQVGPGPWYPSQNIVGGEVHGNEVRGAKVGINVDGAGDRRVPIAIFANMVSDVPVRAHFSECARRIPTNWMNVSPTSVVDRRNELVPTGTHLSDPCQLWSDVAPDTP